MASSTATLPIENLRTLQPQISQNIQSDRLVLQLAAAFAVLATVLAMLGLYGVMAHSVTRRTREIGIRMALGARPARIRAMVMREMLWILALGLAAGIPVALALATLHREPALRGEGLRCAGGGCSRRRAGRHGRSRRVFSRQPRRPRQSPARPPVRVGTEAELRP